MYIFVDLQKAYDRVKRDKLFELLWDECKDDDDRCIVKLLADLFERNEVFYDDKPFPVERGVMQGGVISPFLFNFYLEKALMSQAKLREAITEGLLIAFADDLMLSPINAGAAVNMIVAMEALEAEFGLKLNKDKTVILSDRDDMKHVTALAGVKKKKVVKYLGMNIALDREYIKEVAKDTVRKNSALMTSRITA